MHEIWLYILFFLVAFFYSSIGHGGASGYLAVMALLSFSPAVMKPTSLLLNTLVSFIAFVSFYRAGHFKSKLLWPLIAASIPFAFIGSIMPVSDSIYKKLLGVVLLISIIRLLYQNSEKPLNPSPKWYVLFVIGAIIGLISGMIGMGGGILLAPVLLLMGWSTQKQTAAICAIFIFLNSLSGMAGQIKTGFPLSTQIIYIVIIVLLGGWVGAYTGSKKLNEKNMKYMLAVVLIMASIKLLFV
ncbi:sulfite exporter TauE/SafE family protein [Hydrotalea sp.]|uniref:sulfite exporter TauE/SafE family protein n=1 Tax=Hydrotalea sp. TaxID=2881279 RepID=UPI0025900919|nr:sulfite exporter TauE/SafE family protein [Hydrotalea sp.]